MKIWIDGQCLQTGSSVRGIGRYVIDFLRALSSHNIEIVVSLNGVMQQETVAARNYINKFVPDAEVVVWYGVANSGEIDTNYCAERMVDEKILAFHINEISPDIALSASLFEGAVDQSSPLIKICELDTTIKTACIFYDAIPHRYSDIYLENCNYNKFYYRRLAEIPMFDHVLCISQFTQNEYQEIFDKTNSAVIYAGLSNVFHELIENWFFEFDSLGAQLGKYIVYVGGIDWRKNVPFLVKSMVHLPQCQTGELKLVLVGAFGDEYIQPLKDIFNAHNIPDSCLVTTGYISDKELVDIYKNSLASVQPSRMEGFGLGALEAMACGTPFFFASGTAVEEVVQNEAQMFDPDDCSSLILLLQKSFSNEKFRINIVERGYQSLKKFSWVKTAEIAMEEFHRLLKSNISLHQILKTDDIVNETKKRLIMDVTSTSLSHVMSGIERVMYKLSSSALKQNKTESTETVLSFSKNTKDWYRLSNLDKSSIKLLPKNRIEYLDTDTYLLLDSSWTFIEGQKQRLADVLVMGQSVIHGVYDLGPITMPAMTTESMPTAFSCWLEFILGYSTGIVCISRAVADEVYELIQSIKLPRPMKIGYFRLGADFTNAEPDSRELGFTKTRPMFLMVGTIEPRKGQFYCLKAFEKLWMQGIDVNLVIIGKAGWNTKVFQAILHNHPESNKRLFWRKDISDAGLAAAYHHADALIMSSYLEGFGLPVVEAGQQNTPVIMSDLPVFREVGKGTPKARYFIPGSIDDLANTVEDFVNHELSSDYAHVKVDWPTWDESTTELKNVVLNNNWYKYYEPEKLLPNVGLNDIGDVTTKLALNIDQTQHELRIIEGPFLSDDGFQLHIAVAVKNLSDMVWSSNNGQPLGVTLTYHLYDREGDCISYDNPRTHIPFVLSSGKEILMPIRINSDWLVKGANTAGIELVQDGVRWFGNEQKLNLLKPVAHQAASSTLNVPVVKGKTQLIYLRGPFEENIPTERYFIFAVINNSGYSFSYANDNTKFKYSFIDKEGNKTNQGIWAVNYFEDLEINNFGYIALFADARHLYKSESICIETNGVNWLFNIGSQELFESQNVDTLSTFNEANDQFNWLENLDEENISIHEVYAIFREESNVSLRGFNTLENTHVWMSKLAGEIDLMSLVKENTYARGIKITCSPFIKDIEPIELSLYIDTYLVEKKVMSHDFMEYTFSLSKSQFIKLCKNRLIITLVTNHNGIEKNGHRLLSLCLAKLTLMLQK